jgi:GNAT superfamily N-acetyltransferase
MSERGAGERRALDDAAGPALLLDGRSVLIRPAAAGDEPVVRAFYDGLSERSAYFRFFGMRPALPSRELRAALDPQSPGRATLLVCRGAALLGVGEMVVGPGESEAEVAFAVADADQQQGVGTLLLERLAVVARRWGLHRLVATTLPGNHLMHEVLRTCGLDHHSCAREGEVVFTLELASIAAMQAAAHRRRQVAEAAAAGMRRARGTHL